LLEVQYPDPRAVYQGQFIPFSCPFVHADWTLGPFRRILLRVRDVFRQADPLGEALHFLRMSGAFYCRSELTAPWGLALPPMKDCLSFHVVTAGRCWLQVDGAEDLRLEPDDLALVPHGRGHRLCGEPGTFAASVEELEHEYVSDHYAILRHGGGGAATSLICGAVRFDHPAAHHLVTLLPRIIHIKASSSRRMDWIQSTLRLMAAEAKELRPGGETVITRLSDILVIQAIRSWLEQDSQAQSGWLGAFQDRQIGAAIALIHREPARPFSVASLATEVAMSRSAFAARFTELVGEPVMRYVARWRMHVARTWLEDEEVGLSEMAGRLGYQSEAAFSRAFKRFLGVSPGSVRRGAASRTAMGRFRSRFDRVCNEPKESVTVSHSNRSVRTERESTRAPRPALVDQD
jgi:AraC-like DNA-binding protein